MLVPLIAFNDDSEQYRPAELDPAPSGRRRPHHGRGGGSLEERRGPGDDHGVLDVLASRQAPRRLSASRRRSVCERANQPGAPQH